MIIDEDALIDSSCYINTVQGAVITNYRTLELFREKFVQDCAKKKVKNLKAILLSVDDVRCEGSEREVIKIRESAR